MTGGLALIQRPEEVEASLWRRLRFEEEGECREILFNRYLALAKAIASREFRRRPPDGLERSDFEQLAMSGLLEAIDRFNPMLGATFASFAKHRIRGAIADGAARSSEKAAQYTFRRRLEMERLSSLAPGETSAAAADPISDLAELAMGLAIGIIAERANRDAASATPYETDAWRDVEHRVMSEIALLPDTQRSIMIQHYQHGVAFSELAVLLRLSKGRISQIHRAAIAHLRERLKGLE